jgi:phage-related protein
VGQWRVLWLPEAEKELTQLPLQERAAMMNAVLKLEAVGPRLTYLHSSDVRGSTGLRELRPRAGRSPWRGLYQRVGPEVFVVAAIAPEAQVDHRGFARATAAATTRLSELEDV